ncbi:MAG: magnesium transporter CorA family protein [Gammaproteobacteria bacterium]
MEIYQIVQGGTSGRLAGAERLPENGFLWIDVIQGEADWADEVRRLSGVEIHEYHLKDAENQAHPSYFDATAQYEMVVFRSLAPESGGELFSTRPTTFFVMDRLLVTVRPEDSRSVTEIKEKLFKRKIRVPRRPIGLCHLVITAMVDRFLALREALADQLEEWRDALIDPKNPFDDWMLVLSHRNRLHRLGALCEEQEEALLAWREGTSAEVDDHLAVRLADLLEHIQRVRRFALDQQSQVEALVQLHFSAVAHRTNEIMRVLTILSAIFLPLSLIAGIFGMNFEYMPELKWRYGYFVALGVMALLAAGLLILFRRKRWL